MGIDFVRVYGTIKTQLQEAATISEGVNAVIDACEEQRAHKDWKKLRKLDFDADAAKRSAWLPQAIARHPPRWSVSGIWFGLHNPIYRGRPTADIRVAGAFLYDDFDDNLVWASKAKYRPTPDAAKSSVLNSIYKIAYRTDDSLKNDAEYSLCLAYGSLLAQSLLIPDILPLLAPPSGQIGAAVGFDSGDFIRLGILSEDGLAPPKDA